MGPDYNKPTNDITYLLDKIIDVIPAPKQLEGTPQMLITSLSYSSYTGRIAVGRVHRGTLTTGMDVTIAHRDGTMEKTKIKDLQTFEGMGHAHADSVSSGDICAIVGLENFEIGDTICDLANPEPLPPIAVDEPTMSMLFTINDSPFFGREGKYCTSRHIGERLQKERERTLDHVQCIDYGIYAVTVIRLLLDHVGENLAVGGRVEKASAVLEPQFQLARIDKVAVVREGEIARIVVEEERLHVLYATAPGRRIAHVAYGHVARQRGQAPLVEDLGHEALALDMAERTVVHGDDTATLLSAVLQGVQAVICESGRIGHPEDTENAAFVMQLVVYDSLSVIHLAN